MGYLYKSGHKYGANSVRIGSDEVEELYLDLPDYQVEGSVDKELYDAIVALGWDSDVLEV